MTNLTISCLCGQFRQTVASRPLTRPGPALCHCDTCRHVTGQLFTSYLPVEEPDTLAGLVRYTPSAGDGSSHRWFCGTCGCHLFRRGDAGWEVATGCVVAEDVLAGEPASQDAGFGQHINVRDTVDGGLAVFLRAGMEADSVAPEPQPAAADAPPGDTLRAACHCGRVCFHITRPDTSSRVPRSNFPDLLIPYHTRDPKIQNPDDEKWWLRLSSSSAGADAGPAEGAAAGPDGRYLAGTCACRSCRLASGFEVQSWGFVPASNVFFAGPPGAPPSSSSPSPQPPAAVPLDFAELRRAGVLRSYGSSPGVLREFCPGCGATVFWHDAFRPLLLDVSLGLLRAAGARAEAWLDWHRGRVSFFEEAARGREAAPRARDRARHLMAALETGLRGV